MYQITARARATTSKLLEITSSVNNYCQPSICIKPNNPKAQKARRVITCESTCGLLPWRKLVGREWHQLRQNRLHGGRSTNMGGWSARFL